MVSAPKRLRGGGGVVGWSDPGPYRRLATPAEAGPWIPGVSDQLLESETKGERGGLAAGWTATPFWCFL